MAREDEDEEEEEEEASGWAGGRWCWERELP